jgi:penicillin-binding protein 1A
VPKKPRSLLGRVVNALAVACVWAAIALAAVVAWYGHDLPDVAEAMAATRRPAVTLLARDGSELLTIGDLYGRPLVVAELPPALVQAVVATEDRRYYRHLGLDPLALLRAAYANIRAGRIVQGGSTITQQVAKNLFLTPERTLKRKVQELLLALWLERKFAKDEILAVYLNRVYFGQGTYGVEAAARRYFGRGARDLDAYEAAMLAGLLKAPSRYNPHRDPELATKRTEQVLANMEEAGFMTAAEARAAARRKRLPKAAKPSGLGRHFADWVLDQVPGYAQGGDRDLIVVTTLDARLQREAERLVAAVLDRHGAKSRIGEAALVAMTPAGAVRAMVGGGDYADSQFNRATQALRQPGSAFKPFVYLAALEAGLAPEDRVVDAPLTVDGWSPRNFDGTYLGEMSVEDALARSINTAAVRLSERVGRGRAAAAAKRLGITTDLGLSPSLALGSEEVTLIDLVTAYAAFARDGAGAWAYGVEEIREREGRVLYRRSGSGPGRVVEAAHARAMNRMLARAVEDGTGRAARPAGWPDGAIAGKTGTSQGFRDAWFVGYGVHVVAGVWMGNDDDQPMLRVTGGGLPAVLWRDFIAAAHQGLAPPPLPLAAPPPAEEPSLWRRLFAEQGPVERAHEPAARSSMTDEQRSRR